MSPDLYNLHNFAGPLLESLAFSIWLISTPIALAIGLRGGYYLLDDQHIIPPLSMIVAINSAFLLIHILYNEELNFENTFFALLSTLTWAVIQSALAITGCAIGKRYFCFTALLESWQIKRKAAKKRRNA